ncbi:hypothetical protein DSM112329_02968 [Paraconexibacter sp. AEG42_29]|uniref:Apea-like HEPN domain-containing protein n=1 Tax=Paraconexibacter sp. AEG42_29 TaxID=2997339 RepID=A0AAU7AXF6_9ACTN
MSDVPTKTGKKQQQPEAVDGRLIATYTEIVAAVTPYDRSPGWDDLWRMLPDAASAHPRWSELVELVGADRAFDRFYDRFFLSTGTGVDAGLEPDDIALDLVSRPWLRMNLAGWPASAESLDRSAWETIDDARALACGQTIQVPARFMFDGPKMSKRFSRDTAFGRVCWTKIPPPYEEAPPFTGLTIFTRLPLYLIDVPEGKYFYARDFNRTQAAIDRFVSQFRVALMSRSQRNGELGPPARVTLVQLATLIVGPGNQLVDAPDPFGHGFGVRDLPSVCDLMERFVVEWDTRVDTAARRLGQARARSGQQVASHLAEDTLVDAMIALESLFSVSQELSFRLSAAVAHLLGEDRKARHDIFRQVKTLYGLRSKIVHGGTVPELINDEEDSAIRLVIRVLEALLFERRDLLAMKDWELSAILGMPTDN